MSSSSSSRHNTRGNGGRFTSKGGSNGGSEYVDVLRRERKEELQQALQSIYDFRVKGSNLYYNMSFIKKLVGEACTKRKLISNELASYKWLSDLMDDRLFHKTWGLWKYGLHFRIKIVTNPASMEP